MAEKTINARIQCKIDTAENWKTNNPVLLVGELGVESDTKLIKVGDGTTSWTSLPYLQYLPLSGGAMTGALKIAKGTGNGIKDYDGNPMLYIDNYDDLYIRNDSGTEIHLGWAGEHIQIGGNKVLSDTNVVGHSFTFNDKSVAVTSDIPKTLNNKTLVANGNTTIYGTDITLASDNTSNVTDAINNANTRIDNLTTTVNGKANLSGGNTFSGTQTFNNGITLANDTAINNASGNNVITTQTGGHTILGDPNGLINIQGSTTRPLYTKKDSGSEQLALYTDTTNKLPLTGGTLTGGLTCNQGVSINADYGLNIADSNGNGLSISNTNNTPRIISSNGRLQFMKNLSNIWTIGIDSDGGLVFIKE